MSLQMLYSVYVFHAGSSGGLSADCSGSSNGITVITRNYMEMQELDQVVQRYFAAGLARATHKTYQSAECRYLEFCSSFSILTLPISESILCSFVACLGQ